MLVTGHSLGGAVANLLAADLNDSIGPENVYAYTFASPTVTNTPNIPIVHDNIFNILNDNDFVTIIPGIAMLFGPWLRHGLEGHVVMTDKSIIRPDVNHAMPTYMEWMEKLPDILVEKQIYQIPPVPEDIIWEDIEALAQVNVSSGQLPRLLSFESPVDITLYDSNGNEVADVFSCGTEDRKTFILLPYVIGAYACAKPLECDHSRLDY